MKYNERNAKQYDFGDDDVTESCVKKKLGFAPIVGWLVCIDGECKGKDYPIRGERNYVGRDRSMDICIMDETVSRNNHASVNFDDRAGKYYYSPGMGRTIDHINDNPVFGTVELKKNDIIEIGSTKMLFVPLCGDKYQKLAKKEGNVIFGGRLGMYRYFDMWQVIDEALKLVGNLE